MKPVLAGDEELTFLARIFLWAWPPEKIPECGYHCLSVLVISNELGMGAQNTTKSSLVGPLGLALQLGSLKFCGPLIYPLIHLLCHHGLSLQHLILPKFALLFYSAHALTSSSPEGLCLQGSLFCRVCTQKSACLCRGSYVAICLEQDLCGREWKWDDDVYSQTYLTCGNITDAIFRLAGFDGNGGLE